MHAIIVGVNSERPFVSLFGAIRRIYTDDERAERQELAKEINASLEDKPTSDEVVKVCS